MPWGVAAAVVSAGAGIYSANKAADAQTSAANAASGISRKQYQVQRKDFEPYRLAGSNAINALSQGTNGPDAYFMHRFGAGDFQEDPGYQFRLSQGMNGIQGSAAARGGLLSGGTLKALNQYNQNFASNEYNNAYSRYNTDVGNQFSRLNSLAQTGLNAAAQTGNAGSNMANQVSSNTLQAGNAQSAGYIGGYNALANGINTGASIYGYNHQPGK